MARSLFALNQGALSLYQNIRHAPFKVARLWGLPIACLRYEQVLAYLEQRVATRSKTFCVTLNLNIFRLAYENPTFYKVIQNADLIFADGMPIVWLSRLGKSPLPERVPGCDIIYDLCKRSHENGYRIFMLGAAPGVAEQAAAKLRKTLPQIQIVGTYAPSPLELSQAGRNDRIIETINRTSPDILLVALGAPKQEIWIQKNYHRLNASVIIPCGASIDYLAGVQKKSPKWLGKLGLEWLFRLTCSPVRLFERYILRDLPFLCKILINHSKNDATQSTLITF